MDQNQRTFDTDRLKAFSDGVFAVAITLLVLNIQVPHLGDASGQPTLLSALLRQWPVYISYVVSFFTIGVVWANHHRTFLLIEQTDYNLLMFNLFLLMTVTLIPFTTALLSEYIEQPGEQRTATVIYCLGWVLLAVAYGALWRYAVRRRLVDGGLTAERLNSITRRNQLGLILYGAAFLVSFFSVALAVLICAALAIYYVIPQRFSDE